MVRVAIGEVADIDHRPSLFFGLTQENLARHVADCARTTATPAGVAELLSEARRTFVGGATCYDNFASATFKSLQAAEHALRTRIWLARSRRKTFGQILRDPAVENLLTPGQLEWFREFALRFRNALAHPQSSIAITPGMAEQFIRSAHQIVAEVFADG